MTVEQRLAILETAVNAFVSLSQVQALIASTNSDIATLEANDTAMNQTLNYLVAAVQSLKESINDHETRITALE